LKTAVFALSAAVLAFACTAPARAVTPAAVGHATVQSDGVTQVQYKKKNYKGKYYKGKGQHRHGYRAGHRYKHAPRGWHRYNSRPSFWQTRGCVVVGPVWFCP